MPVPMTTISGGLVRVTMSEAGVQGPPGPDGASAYEVAVEQGFVGDEQAWLDSLALALPDAGGVADGSLLGLALGAPTWLPPPAGTGDMQSLIYDPRGIAADAFDASHLTGNIDGGVFT